MPERSLGPSAVAGNFQTEPLSPHSWAIMCALDDRVLSWADTHSVKLAHKHAVCNARRMGQGVANGHDEEEEERGLRAILRVKVEITLDEMIQCSLANHWKGKFSPSQVIGSPGFVPWHPRVLLITSHHTHTHALPSLSVTASDPFPPQSRTRNMKPSPQLFPFGSS